MDATEYMEMFPKPEWEQRLERNVDRGVKFLDDVRPGWHNQVDTSDLDMSSAYRCICGYVFQDLAAQLQADSGYDAFTMKFVDRDEYMEPALFGFESPSQSGQDVRRDYSCLAEIWLSVIDKRKADEGTLTDGGI